VVLCGALRATAAGPSVAENQPAMQGASGIVPISALVGTTVIDRQGQRLGQIKDGMLDSRTGQVSFVVLDAEVLGSGHAMLVVPYQALRVSFSPTDNRRSVVLDLRPEHLRAAPQIDKNQWQMLQNPQFLEQARNFYQVRPYSAARPIESPTVPGMLSVPSVPCPPIQWAVPRPPADPYEGWSESLKDFGRE
jgi:sporulation protein YlmC with PRC-barrel domain